MVFEALVVEFLNRFLKQYVENLDTSQLKIGIWGGDVVLHDLKIKSTLFDELNLPLSVKWGKLGKFAMKIPWKNLYSAQVVIDIEELLLVIVSNVSCTYDAVKEEKWALEKKLARLKAIEDARKHDLETDMVKQNDSFLEKLLTQITKNLQIVIRNIHIRYEDKTTIPNSPFSVGITLSHLSARTMTHDPTKLHQQHTFDVENLICKLIHLEGLAIYWNSGTELFSDLAESTLRKLMLSSIPAANHLPENYMYMFGPLSASAFLRLNPKPEIDGSNFQIPKIFVNVHLKEIDLAVTHSQFKDVVTFLQDYQRQAAAAKYKKFRPVGVPVIGHAETWWKFAFKAVMEDILRRRNEWTWVNIKEHRRKCRRYLDLFKMKVYSKKMTVAETRELNELEKMLNVFNLILIREQVYVEYERNKETLKEVKPKGWFSGWFGSGSESRTSDLNDEELVKKLESVMTVQEKQKLYKAIGYEESAPPANYPTSFVEIQFWFQLDEMKLTVYDDPTLDSSPVMVLSVKTVKLEFERRPSAFAMKFILVIGNFKVTGKEEKDATHPALVTSNCKDTESLVEIIYETKPLDSTCDQRVIINARPLNIIFHASTVNLVRDIFSSESSGEMEKIVAATSASLPTFRSITSAGLQYAIEKRTVLEVKVHIKSSYLIIPYGGVYRQDTDMLVLMLGSLSIESEKNINKDVSFKKLFIEGISDEKVFSAVLSESYTKFKCRLTGVQILFQLKGEDWVAASRETKSALQFLEPTNLEVTIKKALVVDDARIPKMIVEGKLPSLTFNFSEERFVGFVALICSIPTKTEKHPRNKKASSVSSWSIQSFSTQLESRFLHRSSQAANIKPQEYTQGIDLVGHFEMNELKVHVSKTARPLTEKSSEDVTGGGSEEKFLDLSLERLEVELTSKTFETVHLLKLGGIDFKQYLKKTWLPLLSPKPMKQEYYLFVVEYINLDTKIPDFYTTKGGINNRLTFNVTPMNILLEREALLAQIAFVKNVQKRIDFVKGNTSSYRIADAGKINPTEEENLQPSGEKKVIGRGRRFRRKSHQQEVIDFFLQVSLEEITVGVEFRGEGLTEFNLKGGNIDISHRKSYSTLDVNIREVCISDFNPQSKHKKILESLESQTLSSRMTIYNKEYFGAENTMDMSIDAELGGIQVTCLSIFCSRGLAFLEAFQVQVDTLKENASMAAQKAKKNVVRAFQNAAQICLNVKITAPILLIPRNSHSQDTLIVDLGVLTIKNTITELDYGPDSGTSGRPLIDTMKLHLHNLKVTRSSDYSKADDERIFLVPVSFELTVKRNLSTAWFRVIPKLEVLARLASIRVNLTHEDLCAIFTIVQDNLAEGERDKAERISTWKKMDPKYITRMKAHSIAARGPSPDEGPTEVKKSSTHIYTIVKFQFLMDSFIFDALNEKKDVFSTNTGLAQFVLEAMSVKGRMFSNGAINTSLMLASCVLDDTRPGKAGKLTRLMERTKDSSDDSKDGPAHCMIEVKYQKKDFDSFVDVRVYKFTLALSMEFLHKLGIFFTLKKDLEGTMGALESTREYHKAREKRILAAEESDRPPTFTVNVRLEKPDIIFVENMDSINTDALIFHTEMVMKYRLVGEKQVISGALRDIELYSCCFNPAKRPHTLNQVIKPFSISVAGSTPEGMGLHVDVCLTNIVISINPSAVDLISKCYEVLLKDTLISKQKSEENIYTDLWEVKPFSEDVHLFFKTEMGEDALKVKGLASSANVEFSDDVYEICLLAIPSIIVYLEGMSSHHSHPLLVFELGYQMRCHNWSQKMVITNTLSVEIQYYNKTCSAWEPLLEPVEKSADLNKPVHTPWEIYCTIHFNEEEEIEGLLQPKTQVTVYCEEIMQLTFTKTCVEVLKTALDTYTTVVTKHVVKKITDLPDYVVKNGTGLVVELLLDESRLQVCKSTDARYNTVRLNTNSEVELKKVVEASDLYRTERRAAAKQSSGLYVKFPTLRDVVIRLPMNVSSKRFFPLPSGEPGRNVWGLVSEVSIFDQSTTIVLQSLLKVINLFNEPIHIHALSDGGEKAEYIGTVEGNSSFSLPIHACYKGYKNLFFSVTGYSLSTSPFPWEDLRYALEISLLLMCMSKSPEDQDPFFIEAFGETEQIYYAETKRKTASCMLFKIHLQPTVKIFNSLPVPLEICCQGSAHERILQPGNHTQITNAEPGSSTITLRISDYLEKEWSCKETFLRDPEEFLIWKFVSYNGLTTEMLNLGIHVTFSKRTAVYSIYSPYFMVNKTGHLLSYKFEQSTTVFYHPGNLNLPVMFSPTSKKFYGKKAATLQVEQSSWSDKFPVDVAGSGGTIECRDADLGITYKVSVNITLTYNSLTKIVVFTPFYVMVNSLDFGLQCQETAGPAETWMNIPPKSYVPFWPTSLENNNTLRLRPKGSEATTPPFAYHSTDDCLLRLNHECGGIFVNVKATQSGTCITYGPYEQGHAPALIVNHSEKEIKLYEEGTDFSVTVPTFHEVMFAWTCPTGARKLVLYDPNQAKEVIPLDEDVFGIFHVGDGEMVKYVSFLDGPQRVLVFDEDNSLLKALSCPRLPGRSSGLEIVCKIRGVGVSLINNNTQVEIMYMEMLSSDVSWEMKKHTKNQFKPMKKEDALQVENAYQNFLEAKESCLGLNVNPVASVLEKLTVDFEKMEMTVAGKPTVKQLKRMYEPGLWVTFRQIEKQTMLHVKINKIQVDSQLHECVFPVVLAVIPPPKSVTLQEPKPFLELSVVRIAERRGVDQYKYFKTLVQEFHVKFDIAFIQQVYLFMAAEEMSEEQHKTQFKKNLAFTAKDLKDHLEVASLNERKIFFELLHFPPLKIHFSFSLAGKLESGDYLPPSLSVLLQSLGVTLTDVHDVVFRMSYLDRKNVFLTRQELHKEVVSHYFGQAIRQAYVLLLGLDVIGNPYGLIVGIGEGVEAFFYEPFQGMIQGPSEFGRGMAIGCKSLFGHTVGSAAGTLGKLTETLGKGLAVLSLDREYQMQRMVEQNRQDNIQASMARGGRGLVMGVVEGVSGVVQKPLQGAKEEGVGGFFKGMGKGLMGLMTRPVTGVVDFASTSLNAVKRVAVLSSENKRLRPPRYFRDDNLVEPYNLREAQGNLIFIAINKGKYCKTDKYEYHLYLKEREIVLLTNKRLILAEHSDVFGTWQEHMAITWKSMPDKPHCHTKGVALSIPPRSSSAKHDRVDIKVLLIEEEATKMAICRRMEEIYRLEKECGECPLPS